jgi:hypothetical protein
MVGSFREVKQKTTEAGAEQAGRQEERGLGIFSQSSQTLAELVVRIMWF